MYCEDEFSTKFYVRDIQTYDPEKIPTTKHFISEVPYNNLATALGTAPIYPIAFLDRTVCYFENAIQHIHQITIQAIWSRPPLAVVQSSRNSTLYRHLPNGIYLFTEKRAEINELLNYNIDEFLAPIQNGVYLLGASRKVGNRPHIEFTNGFKELRYKLLLEALPLPNVFLPPIDEVRQQKIQSRRIRDRTSGKNKGHYL
ncbi:hypothetical protein ACQKLP_10865 [Chitinophaga sp. NPDC101104]|uniref:hypothetical protein n=1 Tax=Chitinophaga sp. NPDC101104 TaxID=3390561 RepID=UPI003CFF2156